MRRCSKARRSNWARTGGGAASARRARAICSRACWSAGPAATRSVADEYERRLQAVRSGPRRPELETLERQLGKLRTGAGRLIDSYAEGVISKAEFDRGWRACAGASPSS